MMQLAMRSAAAASRSWATRVTLPHSAAAARSVATSALDPAKTALVLIEYQNEFVTPGGKLHEAVKPVMDSTQMLAKTAKVVDAARKKGVLVVHAPITFADNYPELPEKPYGILAAVKGGECFKKSGWGSQFCEEIKPAESDVVVEGKRGLCGFASTNLDFILRQRGVTNIVLGGFLTNCCVESTMRSAYERGFNVTTLTDCCATTSLEAQDAAVKFTFPMFSTPTTADEFLKLL